MTDIEKNGAHLTADTMVSGGVLPLPMPVMEAFNLVSALKAAFLDLKFEVEQVTVNGNEATVNLQVSGTHTAPLSIPLPGMPGSIPPTGEKASPKDTFVVTVQGDKVSQMRVEPPDRGGLPVLSAQLGVQMPGM
jgi:SnoaL-like polyketide cyclase